MLAIASALRQDRSRSTIGALAVLGLAAVIGRLGATGGPLCDPDSLLQPHGFWHVAAAAALGGGRFQQGGSGDDQLAVLGVDGHGVALAELPREQPVGERIGELALDRPLQGSGPVHRVEAGFREQVQGLVADRELDAPIAESEP